MRELAQMFIYIMMKRTIKIFQRSRYAIAFWNFLVVVFLVMTPPAYAAVKPMEAGKIFAANCAGCHANGGNIVRRGKNLKLKALEKNGVDNVDAIAQLVTNGKNNMSAYQDRLTTSEIQAVSAYVLEQAKTGWKSGGK